MAQRPPLGVLNRTLHEEIVEKTINEAGGISLACLREIKLNRLEDLKGAIQRYAEVGKVIPPQWGDEYNELAYRLGRDDR